MCIMYGGIGYLVVVGLFHACVRCSLFDKNFSFMACGSNLFLTLHHVKASGISMLTIYCCKL